MVGMANGVMENAGLTLDRYGLPIIPGSAVKGCARRAALAALREWCESGVKPNGDDNLFTPLCLVFNTPEELLTCVCLVFGWVEQDWSTEKNKGGNWVSDLVWACAGPGEVFVRSACMLCEQLDAAIGNEERPWDSLPNFAGCIAFLHASPNRDPGLVLDILTPHHTAYYESTNPNAVAADTEEPVPVLFPAIKEQREHDCFTFPLIPLRNANQLLLTFAVCALRTGLETFGIGAKANAGYGSFDASESFNESVLEHRAAAEKRRREEQAAAELKARQDLEAKAKAAAKAELEAALEGLSPEEREDKKIELLSDGQFDSKVRAFCKDPKKGGPTDAEKPAILRALRGSRLAYWQDFKSKATKGDLATVDQAIRSLSKTLNLGKMP
nr:type III-B CRISPR module RAMP protein Cmr6 [Prosthecobacter sp.]